MREGDRVCVCVCVCVLRWGGGVACLWLPACLCTCVHYKWEKNKE